MEDNLAEKYIDEKRVSTIEDKSWGELVRWGMKEYGIESYKKAEELCSYFV